MSAKVGSRNSGMAPKGAKAVLTVAEMISAVRSSVAARLPVLNSDHTAALLSAYDDAVANVKLTDALMLDGATRITELQGQVTLLAQHVADLEKALRDAQEVATKGAQGLGAMFSDLNAASNLPSSEESGVVVTKSKPRKNKSHISSLPDPEPAS